MITHSLLQGSREWQTLRARHFTASEAPAMMGCSPYQSRSELLHQKATGIVPEVDVGTAMRFENGHAAEAAFRPLAEEIVGEELYPVTGTLTVAGLELLASFDGLTMDEQTIFEHKAMNAATARYLVETGEPPMHHIWQLEHQLLVSGASLALFVTSDGTRENSDHVWYKSQPDRREALLAGWHQFKADLERWQPEPEQALVPTGRTPETLPALHIEVTGMVTASNVAEFKAHAMAVFGSINRDLVTDQDFADAEKTVKWCADVENRLEAAKQHALSQTASIDELYRTIEDIKGEARAVRLEIDRLVKTRKDNIRTEIASAGRTAFSEHFTALNLRIGRPLMPVIQCDFGGAIKGKRTLKSMRDAVASEVTRAKIEANAVADRIQVNMGTIASHPEHGFLFPDLPALVLKQPEDLSAVVQSRISAHQTQAQALEQARLESAQAQSLAKTAAASVTAPLTTAPDLPAYVAQPVAPVARTTPSTAPTLKLGDIGRRLGFDLPAAFIAGLGFEPAARVKAAMLYHEADFAGICAALIEHIESVRSGQTSVLADAEAAIF